MEEEYSFEKILNLIECAFRDYGNQDVTVFFHRDSSVKIIETNVDGNSTITKEQKIDLTKPQIKE